MNFSDGTSHKPQAASWQEASDDKNQRARQAQNEEAYGMSGGRQ
jgi:hypothetical protein